MQIISCSLENFASYKELNFKFDEQGLTLIQGPTGAGKSTLCDAIPWVLFGRTAKDGSVDEVLAWGSKDPTKGEVILKLGGTDLGVVRVRGKTNDLFFYDQSGVTRGKDIPDTQKLLNKRLGMDLALYLAGAYFHEFSQTAQFFTTTAKNRRAICEQVVDLSLPKMLQDSLSKQKKELGQRQEKLMLQYSSIRKQDDLAAKISQYKAKAESFKQDKHRELDKIQTEIEKLQAAQREYGYFEEQALSIANERCSLGPDVCPTCGTSTDSAHSAALERRELQLRHEMADDARIAGEIKKLKQAYSTTKQRENVFEQLSIEAEESLQKVYNQLETINLAKETLALELNDTGLLLELTAELRSHLIQTTIEQVQESTNRLLLAHFDAEIKVLFTATDADKLDVSIQKDGNNCVYTQLSKGQRLLLKLCFGLSVMRAVAEHNGISFNCIFLDESMDGLDDRLKLKAFGLLKTLELEYKSIFVVEHSESLKVMFDNQYEVQLVNGTSEITNEKS